MWWRNEEPLIRPPATFSRGRRLSIATALSLGRGCREAAGEGRAFPTLLPLGENAPHLGVRRLDRRLRAHLVACRLGEHRGDDEGVENLIDRRGGIARVTDIRRPCEDIAENGVLVVGNSLRIV